LKRPAVADDANDHQEADDPLPTGRWFIRHSASLFAFDFRCADDVFVGQLSQFQLRLIIAQSASMPVTLGCLIS
jgi:hypothetical protein